MNVVTTSKSPIDLPNGVRITPVIDRTNSDGDRLSVARVDMPVGTSTLKHYHRITEELYVVIEGLGEMQIDGENARIVGGQSVRISPNTVHVIRNIGHVPLVFLAVCNPAFAPDDEIFTE
jgi:mannose-6-phosphate isomerase-like protein (cupin superfamily)